MPDAAASADDSAARARALDVGSSFLVQAPAGSGKTGLLIQRVLALLATVERPEQILAMTFTRKAAAEMRERVLHALRDARDELPVDAHDAHAVRTRALAQAALARDAAADWQLVDNPSRLRVLTIDALAAAFARQAPVTTGLGALPAFVDNADGLYGEAVLAALRGAAGSDPAWRTFLAHLPAPPRQRGRPGCRAAGRLAGPARPVARSAAAGSRGSGGAPRTRRRVELRSRCRHGAAAHDVAPIAG